MNGNREQMLNAIEAHHWDYEDSFVYPGVVQVQEPGLMMRKIAGTNSVNANRVIRFAFANEEAEQQIERVLHFFGEQAFAWWIGPQDEPTDLVQRLLARGFEVTDEYVGLAYSLHEWKDAAGESSRHFRQNADAASAEMRSPFKTIDVQTEEQVWEHVRVSQDVWGLSEASAQAAFKERWHYLHLPDRRGGYVVTLHEGRGVGNASYRISRDGKTVYLSGSAVLPAYRKQGIYHELVARRFQIAWERGCEWATTQARVGQSEPILKKLGFQAYGDYKFLTLPL